ncbi:MAG: hydrogenase maturation nickel metallochaperone HypA [Polyangiaceae bacterium]
MHESSLAKAILREVLFRAEEAGARRVVSVHGRVAETEALSRESLSTSFEALAIGTPAEGASLDLELTHVRARCGDCGADYLPEHHVLLCPDCGSTSGEIAGPTGLAVDSIEIEE